MNRKNKAEKWYKNGETLREEGKYEEAIKCYNKAIRLNPNLVKAHNNKGLAVASLGRHDGAIVCFNKVIDMNPNFPQAYTNKSLSLSHLKHYKDAIKYSDLAIKLDPKNFEFWYNKGIIHENFDKFEEAIECYDKVIELNPNFALVYHRKAVALGNLGKYNEAIKSNEKSLEINPKNATVWYSKGVSLTNLGKFEEAITCFDKAISFKSDYLEAYNNKCASLASLGKYEEAIRCFDTAIKIGPKNSDAWFNKGLTLVKLKDYENAIKCFDEVIKIGTNLSLAYNNKGLALRNLGKHLPAISFFDKAIEADPLHDNTFNNKGITFLEMGEYENSIGCFDRAIRINPYFAEAHINKGVALGNIGEYQKEIECYDKAIELNPTIIVAWFNKGIALNNLDKYESAINCFDRVIELDVNFDGVYNNKGTAFEKLGKFEKALKNYDKALEYDSPNIYITYANKGGVLASLGKYDEALEYYDKAIAINNNFAEAYINKGITFLNLHKYNEAKLNFEEAIKIFSNINAENLAKEVIFLELISIDSSKVVSQLESIEENFINILDSSNLKEFKTGILKICEDLKCVVDESKNLNIAEDLIEFIKRKKSCYNSILDALNCKKVEMNELNDSKKFFENWNTYSIITVNCIENFIHVLNNFDSKSMSSEEEISLIKILWPLKKIKPTSRFSQNIEFFQNKKIEGIKQNITAKSIPTPIVGTEKTKTPPFNLINIDATQKERVRVCLVQLDFALTKKFPYTLKDEQTVKKKIFSALKIAEKNKVDVICFPELSFSNEWIETIKNNYEIGIIVCGSYYDKYNRNVSKVIIDGQIYPIVKCNPAITEEKNGTGMEPGNQILIFQTKYGKVLILICLDLDIYYHPHINEHELDIVINPRLDIDKEFGFHEKANIIIDKPNASKSQTFILQTNGNKVEWGKSIGGGGTVVIGYEHNYRIEKNIQCGLRPEKGVKYNLYQVKREIMLITDLKIGPGTDKRTEFCNWHEYDGDDWKLLKDNSLWDE